MTKGSSKFTAILRLPLLFLLAVSFVLAFILTIRTITYKPPDSLDTRAIHLADAVPIDINRVARHLGESIRIKTVSHQNSVDDDPAQWEHLHRWLQASYPAVHKVLKRDMVSERTLIYTWTGTDPSLAAVILMAHQDVVPVSEGTDKNWKHPPFSGELADDAVWGRGSVDDKGSLIAIFESIETLIGQGFVPRRTIYLVSGQDEEVAGGGAQAAAAFLKKKNVNAEFIVDEGLQIISDHPITRGAVALIGVAEKGFGTLQVIAHSEGGHSSIPTGSNAVVTLAKAILAIANHPFDMAYVPPTADMLRVLAPYTSAATRIAIANDWLFAPLLLHEISATAAGAAMLHTTIAPTMLQGSPKENVLPATAIARINFRIDPRDSSVKIMEHTMRAVAGLPVELRWERMPDEPSAISSNKSRAWRILAALAADASAAPVAPGLFIGATDSRYLQSLARDIYRFQPITSSLADLQMVHGTNEHISLKNLEQMTIFYGRLVETAAGS